MRKSSSNLTPGSLLAEAQGCTCPVKLNNRGQGRAYGGAAQFAYVSSCPLHGAGWTPPVDRTQTPVESSGM